MSQVAPAGTEAQKNDLDPFLTNLGRGPLTIEGTLKALSPRNNLMDCMTRHIDIGFDPESLERIVESFVMKGVQGVDDLAGLPTKAVETLDMLQKSQLKVGGDFGVDPKTVKAVNYLVRNIILAMLATALFLGACVLCAAGGTASNSTLVSAGYCFGAVGFALMVYVFLTVKNDK